MSLDSPHGYRREWARRPSTRQFLDLGLHLLFERHFHGGSSVAAGSQNELFPCLKPDDVVNHASAVIRDPAEAESLNKDLWTRTWSHKTNYIEDLIAYLFRPGPYVRRINESQSVLADLATPGITLGELVRVGVRAELESNLNDPLVALQTFVQTALPTRSDIQDYARTLDDNSIQLWERLYERVLTAFGLQLRAGHTWRDLATTFTVSADGALVRSRVRADNSLEALSSGEDVLAVVIRGTIPLFLDIEADEVEGRRLNRRIGGDLG
jgi:hypothetical protein